MTDQDESPDPGGVGAAHWGPANPPMDRLPPPAFPPGHRRNRVHRPRMGADGESHGPGFPKEAFFSPDDPIRRPAGAPSSLIETSLAGPPELREGGRGEVDPMDPPRSSNPAPTPGEIAYLLESLAEEVRDLEGARFGWKAGAPPLEAALRGVLSGYLRQGRGG